MHTNKLVLFLVVFSIVHAASVPVTWVESNLTLSGTLSSQTQAKYRSWFRSITIWAQSLKISITQ
jgi:hypothetical protein